MILHTVNKSPQNPALKTCLRVAAKDSAILLIEDGVYAALEGTELEFSNTAPLKIIALA